MQINLYLHVLVMSFRLIIFKSVHLCVSYIVSCVLSMNKIAIVISLNIMNWYTGSVNVHVRLVPSVFLIEFMYRFIYHISITETDLCFETMKSIYSLKLSVTKFPDACLGSIFCCIGSWAWEKIHRTLVINTRRDVMHSLALNNMDFYVVAI